MIPSTYDISLNTDFFESAPDDIVYFNPHESIGVGTVVGLGTTALSTLGNLSKVKSLETHTISLPNHPFVTNQRVTLTKPSVGYALTVTKDDGVTTFNIPESGDSQDVFIIKKSK